MLRFLLMAGSLALPAWAAGTIRIENTSGDVTIRVERRDKPDIRTRARGRSALPGDVRVEERDGDTFVRAQAADGAVVDLEVVLPYDMALEVSTLTGSLSLTGLVFRARLATETGEVHVTAPWAVTRVIITSVQPPARFSPSRKLPGRRNSADGHWGWVSQEEPGRKWYGSIADLRISGGRPRFIELLDMAPAPDSPIKLSEQATTILDAIQGGSVAAKTMRRPAESTPAPPPPHRLDGPVFVSDVRMVNLDVAVYDARGGPAAGLTPADFEVLEDGVAQELAHAAGGEAEFNLALLLQVGPYRLANRALLEQAAREVVAIASPQDRVAIYTMAQGVFSVASWLTLDQARLSKLFVEESRFYLGGMPIYDAIVLACAEELHGRPRERNALLVLTDGIDGELDPHLARRSGVPFERLRKFAEEMPALIYPLIVDEWRASTKVAAKARSNMQALAGASGGRVFKMRTFDDLKPVAAQVADELRSVYTLSYYPKNQVFDGKWREIQVRVKRPGATFRTRPGYYAQ